MRWSNAKYQEYLKKKKPESKYKAIKVTIDGVQFASKMEANFYSYLKMKYTDIILQPKFNLQPKFKDNDGKSIRAIDYIADFQIGNIVIDVKGFANPIYKLKEKMFKFKYPEYKLLVGTYKELQNLI